MPMRLGTPMPSLDAPDVVWLHSDGAPKLEPGKVTLIHFWAASCHICHETMPEVIRIRDTYVPQGLQVIAVHMPRIEADTDPKRPQADIETYGITQPVALDSMRTLADRFENEYVPAFFLFGSDGLLKFRAAGDKGFQKVEPKIREALGLPPQ